MPGDRDTTGGTCYDIRGLREYQRFVGRFVARVETRSRPGPNFGSSVSLSSIDGIGLAHIRSDGVEIERSARCIEMDSQNQYIIGLNVSGRTAVDHGGAVTRVDPGRFFLIDKAAPYHSTFLDRSERILLSVPRAKVEARLADPARCLAVTPSTEGGVGELAERHLRFLLGNSQLLGRADRAQMLEMCLDLVAMAFRTGDGGPAPAPTGATHGTLLLSRLKASLRCVLDDPDLTPEGAAQSAGLSKRYLHKLFSDGGTSFGSWVREERLNRARAKLLDPRHRHLSITEIALQQGFNDIPHFSRQFKTRFGQSPRDARAGAPRGM